MLRHTPSIPMPARAAEPPTLWALSALPELTARGLDRWLESLAELTLDDWMRIGDQCLGRDNDTLAVTRACARVEKAIDEHELAVTAWLIRDVVETATCHVRRAAARGGRRAHARLVVARMAAEWAALALATQRWLSASDLDALCAPFERARPREESATA